MVLNINQQVMQSELIEEMVDEMLQEVARDYRLAMKKSIMDYILLDHFERGRLGVQLVVEGPAEWGTAAFIGVAQ